MSGVGFQGTDDRRQMSGFREQMTVVRRQKKGFCYSLFVIRIWSVCRQSLRLKTSQRNNFIAISCFIAFSPKHTVDKPLLLHPGLDFYPNKSPRIVIVFVFILFQMRWFRQLCSADFIPACMAFRPAQAISPSSHLRQSAVIKISRIVIDE